MEHIVFSFELALPAWICFGVAAFCAGLLLLLLLLRMLRVIHQAQADDEAELPDEGYPSVSVVVYAQNDASSFSSLLDQIFAQDYPAPMEVIVVNDLSGDRLEDVIATYQQLHRNLYLTFTPAEAYNLSRKKLSVTLGIKAAHHDVIMLTCGRCRIESITWLRRMMRHFSEGKEVVIGYATSLPDNDKARRRRAFDTVWDALRYLSSAVSGHPFRGTGCNLAYTRDLFFRNKGFAGSLHLHYGDDDLFVSEVANRENCAVELSSDSIVEVTENLPYFNHRLNRLFRDFIAGLLPRAPFRVSAFESWLWWIWLGASVAALITGYPCFWILPMVTAVSLGLCLPVMVCWRRLARRLKSRPLFFTVPFLMLWHPIFNLSYRKRLRRNRNQNYIWCASH